MRVVVLLVLSLTVCVPAFGQVEEIKATGVSATCGTCFNVALESLKHLSGVSDATGDPHEGWIRISVDPKKGVGMHDVFEITGYAGVRVASFEMKASGTLQRKGNRLVLIVPNQTETIVLDAGDRGQMAMNAAQNRQPMSTSGILTRNGKEFGLKIQTLRKE